MFNMTISQINKRKKKLLRVPLHVHDFLIELLKSHMLLICKEILQYMPVLLASVGLRMSIKTCIVGKCAGFVIYLPNDEFNLYPALRYCMLAGLCLHR